MSTTPPFDDPTAPHLASTELAGYLDSRLAAADRARIEAHLADCAACRGELIDAGRLLKSLPERRSRFMWGAAGAAGVAAAVVALVVARSGPQVGSLRPGERGGDAGTPAIAVVRPGSGAIVSPSAPEFVWHPAGADAQYRVTLTTERGDVVWASTVLADTVRVVPASVRLRGGQEYFWYVDALLPDGRSATSGVRRFTVPP
ncbi:MAG TPA: zf-HC2 domain-containing protein [Gemmatimonadales bacterium]|nr:zf-HC2 domain-containing protein [Gemmatimonadales bacterium]